MVAFKTKKITSAKTVGAKLRIARKKKKLTIEQVEEGTKVRAKYIEAIESDRWREFPSRIYVLGYVRRYAEYLKLDGKKILSEFEAEFGRSWQRPKKRSTRRVAFENVIITPKLIISVLVFIIIAGLIFYIVFSISKFSRPPDINIILPKEEVVSDKSIMIEGKTLETAIVEINSQLVNVDDGGNFSQKVELIEGLNIFEIKAKNRLGKESNKSLKVIYQTKKMKNEQ